ncbi:RagB/SusD family nutrient uptake outer membrane protein [Chryseobacterium sp. POL2]|uniref:RagB/SusD family nutrient uptake outer membrane protein n=1 Tax=Chryseobacterium sp. POL2 TaxID=2713414 RepID=UPI0013E1FAEB|nr:RagB/SusD family nutrient uptake outer membrane protein [Chryseobacterium sp. POL2]QIG90357.1 RagB/SusD family nutrient uptake outer membrane protein [Chryseobacterium sp. POL2]
MKILSIITIVILMILCSVLSCDKLVDVDVPQNQMDKSTVFENNQTAYAALSSLYADLQKNSPLAGDKIAPFLSVYTDDLISYSQNTPNSTYDLYTNLLIDTNDSVYTIWSAAWQQIYLANSILESLEKSTSLSQDVHDNIMGETLFIRSLVYFYLNQVYGDIPYITSTNYTINMSLSKRPETELLELIRLDFQKAASLLKDDYRNAERLYPNKKVVALMLAKVAILQKKWSVAEVFLNDVLNFSLYQPEKDIKKVFLKSGKHILWQLKPLKEGVPTPEGSLYYFNNAAPTLYSLSPDLVGQFTDMDLRKVNWITAVSSNSNTWYRSSKYKNLSANTDEYSIIFRIDEAYLLMAETLIRQGRSLEAIPFINVSRKRAGLAGLSGVYSSDNLMLELALEYRREFFVEQGHRFFDLKRLGLLSLLSANKPNWKSHNQLWPIPQRDILLNRNLNPQNDGY